MGRTNVILYLFVVCGLTNFEVCGALRNRNPRFAPQLVPDDFLGTDHQEILSTTGSLMAQLYHWINVRWNRDKHQLPNIHLQFLSQQQYLLCFILGPGNK